MLQQMAKLRFQALDNSVRSSFLCIFLSWINGGDSYSEQDHENSINVQAAEKCGCPWLCTLSAAPQVWLVCVQAVRCSWSPHSKFLGFPRYQGSYRTLGWNKVSSNDSLSYIINNFWMRFFLPSLSSEARTVHIGWYIALAELWF